MQRRAFLAGGTAILTVAASGCGGVLDEGLEGVVLTHVELGNASGTPRVFDLQVTHDGDIVHWAAHEVGVAESDREMGGTVVDFDGPDDPGQVEVAVRVGREWARTDFATAEYDGERVLAVVTYGLVEPGLLRISRRVSDRSPAGG
jgi:hypothetical protein